MKLQLKKSSTDVTVLIFIQDSTSTAGAGKTGLVYNSSGLVCYYCRPGSAAAQLALVTQTVTGAHADGGFVEVSSAYMPGLYRLDLSDAVCAPGVNSVVVMLQGATGIAPLPLEIQLTTVDPNDANLGLTNLDAAISSRSTFAGGAVASVTGNVGGNVTGSVGSVTGDTKQTGDAYAEAVLVHAHAAGAETQATAAATDAAAAHVQADHIHDTDLPAVKTDTAAILVDTGTTLDAALAVVDGNVDSILADTGTDGVVVAAASKTGYALSTAGVQAIWDALTSVFTTMGSIGKKLADWVVGTIDTYTGNTKQTGDNYARLGAPAGASVSADIAAVKGQTAAIEVDTQDLQTQVGVDGAGLTALGDTRIANLDTTVSSRSTFAGGAVASVTGNVGGNVAGSVGSLAAQAKADVNAEVADVVKVDTIAEMTQGVPPVAPTILEILNHLYRRLRNKVTDDGSNIKVYNDAKDTVLFKAPVSDDGSTFTKDEYVSGA